MTFISIFQQDIEHNIYFIFIIINIEIVKKHLFKLISLSEAYRFNYYKKEKVIIFTKNEWFLLIIS